MAAVKTRFPPGKSGILGLEAKNIGFFALFSTNRPCHPRPPPLFSTKPTGKEPV
jgi:hypothetical protein